MAALTRSGSRRRSIPSTRPSPSVGSRIPHSMRSVVDFPAPLGPRNPYSSPRRTRRSRRSTATTLPKRRESPRVTTAYWSSVLVTSLPMTGISSKHSIAPRGAPGKAGFPSATFHLPPDSRDLGRVVILGMSDGDAMTARTLRTVREPGGLRYERARSAAGGPSVVLLPGLFAGGWPWGGTWRRPGQGRRGGLPLLRPPPAPGPDPRPGPRSTTPEPPHQPN